MRNAIGRPVLAGLALLAACSQSPPSPKPTASLTHTYRMIDEHGVVVGSVVVEPLAGGHIFDADGKEIGRIMPPD